MSAIPVQCLSPHIPKWLCGCLTITVTTSQLVIVHTALSELSIAYLPHHKQPSMTSKERQPLPPLFLQISIPLKVSTTMQFSTPIPILILWRLIRCIFPTYQPPAQSIHWRKVNLQVGIVNVNHTLRFTLHNLYNQIQAKRIPIWYAIPLWIKGIRSPSANTI